MTKELKLKYFVFKMNQPFLIDAIKTRIDKYRLGETDKFHYRHVLLGSELADILLQAMVTT